MAITLLLLQIQGSKRIQELIIQHLLAIVQAPERSGKTLMVIDAAEHLTCKKILVITKKAAISGWRDDLKKYEAKKDYTVINYESLHKVSGDFDLIIIDEFHYAISSFPKTPAKAKLIRDRWLNVAKILISATPAPESASQWFHPLWLCGSHPFSKYKNFYSWARLFVNKKQRFIMGRAINDYSEAKTDRIMDEVRPYLLQITREQTGFKYQPKIVPHYVELGPRTMELLAILQRDRVLAGFVADTPIKLINGLYQIECGCLKIDDEYHDTGGREMVNYIKANFGDTKDVAIMTRWIGQRKIFEKEFKNALILSSHSHAEGVELSHIEHLIIASMDYSTARFQQRNARQASMHRKTPINVHILMTRGNVSEAVFEAVALKHKDFKARMFINRHPKGF